MAWLSRISGSMRPGRPASGPPAHRSVLSIAMSMSMRSSENAGYVVAVDIGGTFTDIALLEAASGRVWRAKTPSVPEDPSRAFMAGVELALKQADAEAEEIGRVLHGTTVATNMILEHKGALTALVTTRGFRHVLTIGRQDIPRKANLYSWVKPNRPVPASRVLEVAERIRPGGVVLRSEEHTSELQSRQYLVCRLLLEKKNNIL